MEVNRKNAWLEMSEAELKEIKTNFAFTFISSELSAVLNGL